MKTPALEPVSLGNLDLTLQNKGAWPSRPCGDCSTSTLPAPNPTTPLQQEGAASQRRRGSQKHTGPALRNPVRQRIHSIKIWKVHPAWATTTLRAGNTPE